MRAASATFLGLVFVLACTPARRSDDSDPGTVSSNPDGGVPTGCATGEMRCHGACIPVTSDNANCGGCDIACSGNTVCSNRTCIAAPSDCRDPGATCPAHSWCNPTDGKCAPGCAHNADCDANGYCDLSTHACRCNAGLLQCGSTCLTCKPPAHATAICSGSTCDFQCASGYHRCGTSCVANNSPSGCGTSCTPCAAPEGGIATCDGHTCGTSCPSGSRLCNGRCATCPTVGVADTSCAGDTCAALSCAPGYALEAGVCRKAWTVGSLANGSNTQLAVSPNGTAYVAWEYSGSFGSGNVKLWNSSSSSAQVTGLIGLKDLAADAQGHAHVLGLDSTSHLTWMVPGVNTGEHVYGLGYAEPVLAVDSAGNPAVSTNSGSSLAVPKFQQRTQTGWTEETITTSYSTSSQDIAISAAGVPWVMLVGGNDYRLAHKESTGWVLDPQMSSVYYPRLALRSDGTPVIASTYSGSGSFFYVRTGSSTEQVDTPGIQPYFIDVAIDSHDQPHVVFSGTTTGGIFYATKKGGSWVREQVSADDSYGVPEIGVDSQGVVHVAWTSRANGSVMHGRRQ